MAYISAAMETQSEDIFYQIMIVTFEGDESGVDFYKHVQKYRTLIGMAPAVGFQFDYE
jgi:hypothetical protein